MYLEIEFLIGFLLTSIVLYYLPLNPKSKIINNDVENNDRKIKNNTNNEKNIELIDNLKQRKNEIFKNLDSKTKKTFENYINEVNNYTEEEMRAKEMQFFLIKAFLVLLFVYVGLVFLTDETNPFYILEILDSEFQKYVNKHVIHYHHSNK